MQAFSASGIDFDLDRGGGHSPSPGVPGYPAGLVSAGFVSAGFLSDEPVADLAAAALAARRGRRLLVVLGRQDGSNRDDQTREQYRPEHVYPSTAFRGFARGRRRPV